MVEMTWTVAARRRDGLVGAYMRIYSAFLEANNNANKQNF